MTFSEDIYASTELVNPRLLSILALSLLDCWYGNISMYADLQPHTQQAVMHCLLTPVYHDQHHISVLTLVVCGGTLNILLHLCFPPKPTEHSPAPGYY